MASSRHATDQDGTRPEELLQRLLLGASHRAGAALRHTHQVCEAQRVRAGKGTVDYSLKTLGPQIAALGGPGARALSNAGGAKCRALIDCHRRIYGGPAPSRRSPVSSGGSDPELILLRSENQSLRKALQAAQVLANANTEVTLIENEAGDGDLPSVRFGATPAVTLNPVERAALRDTLDPRRMARLGWKEDAWGRVVDAHQVDVLPIGFATAWRRLVEAFAPR